MGGFDFNFLTLAASVISLLLGIFVLQNNFKGLLNWLFFIFALSVAIWCFTNYYFLAYSSNVLVFRAVYASGGMTLVLALPWTYLITRGVPGKFFYIGTGLLMAVLALLPFHQGAIIEDVVASNGKLEFISGYLFNWYGALLLLLLFYLLYLLVVGLINAQGIQKAQMQYMLTGVSVFAAVSITFGVLLPILGIKPVVAFDAQSSLVWVALTTYAITRHGLFNVKVIATQMFIGLLLLLILVRVISAKELIDVVFESAVFVLTLTAGLFLIRSVKNEVSRREEVEELAKEKTKALAELEQRNKNLATLQKISRLVLDEIELKPMAQKILDEIPRELENCRGALLNLVKGGQLGAYAISSTDITEKIYRMVGADISKYSYPLKSGFNLLHDAILTRQAKESARLSDFISPPIPKALALTLQKAGRHLPWLGKKE